MQDFGGWLIAVGACAFVLLATVISRCSSVNSPTTFIRQYSGRGVPVVSCPQSIHYFVSRLDKVAPERRFVSPGKTLPVGSNDMVTITLSSTNKLNELQLEQEECTETSDSLFFGASCSVLVDEPWNKELKRKSISELLTEQQFCSICLEEFSSGDNLRFLPCSHCFHSLCIVPWLMKVPTCPLCKAGIWQSSTTRKKECSSIEIRRTIETSRHYAVFRYDDNIGDTFLV